MQQIHVSYSGVQLCNKSEGGNKTLKVENMHILGQVSESERMKGGQRQDQEEL